MTIGMGTDPGYAKAAFGVVRNEGNRLTLLDRGLITTKPDQPEAVRTKLIWSPIAEAIRKWHPSMLGIEDQAQVSAAARGRMAANKFGKKANGAAGYNASNDHVLEVVGLLRGCAIAYGVRYKMLNAQSIKRAVLGKGGGGGDKKQMITAIKAMFPELQLPGVKLSEHEADAIAMAILAMRVDLVGEVVRKTA